MSQWLPLIEDKSLLSWLLKEPSQEDMEVARPVNASQIIKIEEVWRENNAATLEDLEQPGVAEEEPCPAADLTHELETLGEFVS